MRYHFPNLTRPKNSSIKIAKKLGVSLSSVHEGLAKALGYTSWHDLEKNHATGEPFALDQDISGDAFIDRQTQLALKLSDSTLRPNGDTQYALAESRLTGDRPCLIHDQVQIRLGCFRATTLPFLGRRKPGEVGRLKLDGRYDGGLAILRVRAQPTYVLRERNVSSVADFEYVSPIKQLPLFLPSRLYLPYGYYVESDGAKVIHSRDYKPMWRIRHGQAPERLEPWTWIKHFKSEWFWEDGKLSPWDKKEDRRKLEGVLASFGINCLPMLADGLPLLVHDSKLDSYAKVANALKVERQGLLAA